MALWAAVAALSIVTIVGLNGFAAGAVAALHVWRVKLPRESRMFAASAAAGFLPATALICLAMAGSSQGELPGGATELVVIFGVTFTAALVVSLPGAIIVGRKLDHPGEAHRTFE
jgi:hypothetical protein